MTSGRVEPPAGAKADAEVAPGEFEHGGLSDALSHGPPADLEGRLADAEAKRDEYLDLLQRVQAEFENYRKRAARDQERLVGHAHERLVKELLPILDDLERAAKLPVREADQGGRTVWLPRRSRSADLSPSPRLREGVKLVEQSLRKALVKEGLVEIETTDSSTLTSTRRS